MFEVGKRVKITPYSTLQFNARTANEPAYGTVAAVLAERGYSVLVLADEDSMRRDLFPPYIDQATGTLYDYSFTEDGRFVSDGQVCLELHE